MSFWVAVSAALVVGLTRVKPSLFETGLTRRLSYGPCVWGWLTFWLSPHVRSPERLGCRWTAETRDGSLAPPNVCLARTCPCLYFGETSRRKVIWVSSASSFSAAFLSENHEFKQRHIEVCWISFWKPLRLLSFQDSTQHFGRPVNDIRLTRGIAQTSPWRRFARRS